MRFTHACMIIAAALSAVMLSPTTAHAKAPTAFVIDFTGETDGQKPNGYATAKAPGVLFSATSGGSLQVISGIEEVRGTGLVAFGDTAGIQIRLTGPTNSIRLTFGNDDPMVSDPTDQAKLTVFRGATKIAQVLKTGNHDNLPNQTIGYTGKLFTRVQFQMVDAAEAPNLLSEAIDDITLAPLCTVTGSNGNNRLHGTARSDVICGDGGDDTINGRGGADLILGGPGKDVINGGTQRDTCNGGPGRDRAVSCEVRISIP